MGIFLTNYIIRYSALKIKGLNNQWSFFQLYRIGLLPSLCHYFSVYREDNFPLFPSENRRLTSGKLCIFFWWKVTHLNKIFVTIKRVKLEDLHAFFFSSSKGQWILSSISFFKFINMFWKCIECDGSCHSNIAQQCQANTGKLKRLLSVQGSASDLSPIHFVGQIADRKGQPAREDGSCSFKPQVTCHQCFFFPTCSKFCTSFLALIEDFEALIGTDGGQKIGNLRNV